MELQLDFKADIDNIAPVVQRISDLAVELGCESGRELQIALALQEALANAVIHGSKCDPSKTVECRVSYAEAHPHDILIVIRDAGIGFDPGDVPSPKSGENVHFDHGRGIYMIRELMDEVSFAHNGTELRLRAVLSALR